MATRHRSGLTFVLALAGLTSLACAGAGDTPLEREVVGELLPVRDGASWTFEDTEGSFSIGPFAAATPFHDELAWAKKSGQWGLLDPNGSWAVEPTLAYSHVERFHGDLARVKFGGKYGLVNRTGGEVEHTVHQDVRYSGDGWWMLLQEFGECFYFDGTRRLGPYSMCPGWGDSLGAVQGAEGGFGFTDASGKLPLGLDYDSAQGFSEGYAWVQKDATYAERGDARPKGGWQLIAPDGTVAVDLGDEIQGAWPTKSGWSRVDLAGSGYAFVAPSGERLGPYQWADDFSAGLASVCVDAEACSYVDANGEVIAGVLRPDRHFIELQRFTAEGVAWMRFEEDTWSLRTRSGELLGVADQPVTLVRGCGMGDVASTSVWFCISSASKE